MECFNPRSVRVSGIPFMPVVEVASREGILHIAKVLQKPVLEMEKRGTWLREGINCLAVLDGNIMYMFRKEKE